MWHDIHIDWLKEVATDRPDGYEAAIMEASKKYGPPREVRGKMYVRIHQEDRDRIQAQFNPAPTAAVQEQSTPSNGRDASPRRPLPGPIQLARNAAGAIARVVKAVAKNQPVQVSDEVLKARMEVCWQCEFLDKTQARCTQCGCKLASQIIGKARLSTEKCPKGKW